MTYYISCSAATFDLRWPHCSDYRRFRGRCWCFSENYGNKTVWLGKYSNLCDMRWCIVMYTFRLHHHCWPMPPMAGRFRMLLCYDWWRMVSLYLMGIRISATNQMFITVRSPSVHGRDTHPDDVRHDTFGEPGGSASIDAKYWPRLLQHVILEVRINYDSWSGYNYKQNIARAKYSISNSSGSLTITTTLMILLCNNSLKFVY